MFKFLFIRDASGCGSDVNKQTRKLYRECMLNTGQRRLSGNVL